MMSSSSSSPSPLVADLQLVAQVGPEALLAVDLDLDQAAQSVPFTEKAGCWSSVQAGEPGVPAAGHPVAGVRLPSITSL